MKQRIYLSILLIAVMSCKKEKYFSGPNFYSDDFENYSTLQELLIPQNKYWSYTQLTKARNSIEIDSSRGVFSTKSLKFFAQKSDSEGASKSSITKQKMAFWEGETVRLTAHYFISGTDNLNWLFLMDLEEQAAIGAGPGMRIAMVENKLRVEHKYDEKDILQIPGKEAEMPRNQWVELVWEIKLSTKNEGTVKLWQNGVLIIDADKKRTLPDDILYFQQGTKGMYSSCEIGITANSKENDLTLWVDKVKFEKVN